MLRKVIVEVFEDGEIVVEVFDSDGNSIESFGGRMEGSFIRVRTCSPAGFKNSVDISLQGIIAGDLSSLDEVAFLNSRSFDDRLVEND